MNIIVRFRRAAWSCALFSLGVIGSGWAAPVINEIMFRPVNGSGVEEPLAEYVELYNPGPFAEIVGGWQFTKGISFTIPSGTVMAPVGFLVIAADAVVFQAKHPGAGPFVSGWTGTLSNNQETLELTDSLGAVQASVHYATEGDWSSRRHPLGTETDPPNDAFAMLHGWVWRDEAATAGHSMELRNPALNNNAGQNWQPSATVSGTPGAVNGGFSANIAPLITNVHQTPAVPHPADLVTVRAQVADEAGAPSAVTLHWRISTLTPGAFSSLPMQDLGTGPDERAGDGEFAALLPAQPEGTIVEYYVRAADATQARTWPGPTDTAGTQGANALYQVDSAAEPAGAPYYRLILTAPEKDVFDSIADPTSNTTFNATLVTRIVEDTQVRHVAGQRVRGAGSRFDLPRSVRIDVANDNLWQGKSSLNLNSQYSWLERLGAWFSQAGGLPTAYTALVHVRMNGTAPAGSASTHATHFGFYAHVEPEGGEMLDNALPLDSGGNVYSKRSDTSADWAYRAGDVAAYQNDGWSKQTHASLNDWADLDHFLQVVNNASADGAITDPELAAIRAVADVSQWLRYFAVNSVLTNGENSLATGRDDDYSLYRRGDGKMMILPHDFDTILGDGDSSKIAITDLPYTLFDAVVAGKSASTLTPLIPLFARNDIVEEYYQIIRSLLEGPFETERFNSTVDQMVGGLVPAASVDGVKNFMTARRADILAKIAKPLTAASDLAVVSGYPQAVNATTAFVVNGTFDASRVHIVKVNGVNAVLDFRNGTWSLARVSATHLKPGLNRFMVETLDAAGVHLDETFVDIWRDTGTTVSKGGTLAASETWAAAAGPYLISTALTIGSGVTLTIAPGTTVYCANGVGITITGTGRIVAEGTEFSRIRFSRRPGTTDLAGRVFINGATLEQRFVWTDWEWNGGAQGIECTNGLLLFSHSTFRNTDVQYISFHNSSFIIEDSFFQTYTQPAGWPPATYDGSSAFQRPEMLHGATAIPVNGYAIYRRNLFGHTFGFNDVIDFTGGNRPGAILQIQDNVFTAATDDHLDLDITDAWISGNVFLNAHQDTGRSNAIDSSSAISGGIEGSATNPSEWTVYGNIFHHVDHALLAKGKDSSANTTSTRFAFLNNTVSKVTSESAYGSHGGDIAVINFKDNGALLPPLSGGAGGIAEDNVILDAPALVANYDAAVITLTLNNNILPLPWAGPGAGNEVADPLINRALLTELEYAKVHRVEDYKKLWRQAHGAFALPMGSTARAQGAGGLDKGGLIPQGVRLTGVPQGVTAATSATIFPGPAGTFNPAGSIIPVMPYGYVNYRWSLDGGTESAIVPTSTPIVLTGLSAGVHTLRVRGENDTNNSGERSWQTVPTEVSWTVTPGYVPPVMISEVLAINTAAFTNGLNHPDFIELHNPGLLGVDVSGWGVSDDPAQPWLVSLPAGTVVPAGGRLLLLADLPGPDPGVHLGFKLSGNGGSVVLSKPQAAGGALMDRVDYGLQIPDKSISRISPTLAWGLSVPTPGAANKAQAWVDAGSVRINEWTSAGHVQFRSDFVELYNAAVQPASIGGCYLSDDPSTRQDQYRIPDLSFIAGQGFAVFDADGAATSADATRLNFKLDRFTEWVVLSDSALKAIDEIQFQAQPEDVTYGRMPDGASSIQPLSLATLGFSNGLAPTVTSTITNLIPLRGSWHYDETSTALAANWMAPAYAEPASWKTGALPFGFEPDLTAVDAGYFGTNLGAAYSAAHRAYYFRKAFNVADIAAGDEYQVSVVLDDGAVLYLNGAEIHNTDYPRLNMGGTSGTAVAYAADATASVEVGTNGGAVNPPTASPWLPAAGVLQAGSNLLAAEVHQKGSTSSDIVFELKLDRRRTSVSTPPEPPDYQKMRDLLQYLRITELMYDPINGNNFEFIELKNTSATATLDLTGVRLTSGVDFVFPAATLAPGAYVILVRNRPAFESVYGNTLNIGGVFTGKLANEGDRIVLQLPDPWITAIQIFTYQGWWYSQADGGGGSLEIQDAAAGRTRWDERDAWRASGVTGGSPGGQFAVPDFQTWLTAWQLADPLGDSDHDGLTEVAEYAMGYWPDGTDGFAPAPDGGLTPDGRLRLNFSLPAFAPADASYQVQLSSDLTEGTWSTIASRTGNGLWTGTAQVETGVPTGGRVTVLITAPVPVAAIPRQFIRLKMSVP
ncbi:MAG: hypothetical protein JWL81_2995 [Verrucomicrobiales bacterium]|nr:hypothetical protein [Verrucomicrobiales bacterium]